MNKVSSKILKVSIAIAIIATFIAQGRIYPYGDSSTKNTGIVLDFSLDVHSSTHYIVLETRGDAGLIVCPWAGEEVCES